MKEILILSGKGGTGKTTITGSLATLMPEKVLADCDVDAADLHLILTPSILEEHEFWPGVEAQIDQSLCDGCGTCFELCQFQAISLSETAQLLPFSCEGCGVCAHFFPQQAIRLQREQSGCWYLSETDYGTMIHAELGIGEENSGKLVTLVKKQAHEMAEKKAVNWILVDGPPGIGCPVIASMSGASFTLLVTEPTKSGLHDLMRVAKTAHHFKISTGVCINKWDLHPDQSQAVEQACKEMHIPIVGKIPFDTEVVQSIIAEQPLTAYAPDSPAALAIMDMWQEIKNFSLPDK